MLLLLLVALQQFLFVFTRRSKRAVSNQSDNSKYQRQKDLNNVDGNTDGEEEDEGKYFKAKRAMHRVYGKHCS